jgi:hypothetical protein
MTLAFLTAPVWRHVRAETSVARECRAQGVWQGQDFGGGL